MPSDAFYYFATKVEPSPLLMMGKGRAKGQSGNGTPVDDHPWAWTPPTVLPSVQSQIPRELPSRWLATLDTVPCSGPVTSEIWIGNKLGEARVDTDRRRRQWGEVYILMPGQRATMPHALLVYAGQPYNDVADLATV